ncbi:MAG: hypothetical protein K2X27_28410 [Candidatus Obscuribacterales bacterium]|nr:hypothetical protein [Candidatus Obscuribacterales bacterium]
MSKRSHLGGTTALVVVLTLIVILVGSGFFIWMKIIGGGKELQSATDAGNLNVAKQALVAPSIPLSGAEANEFGDLVDPANGQVDLLSFDRLVGKVILVSLNAKAEGTKEASDNAKSLYDMVEGSNGIGKRLSDQLSSHSQLQGFFSAVASSNSTRMLKSDGQINPESSETAVSYMARSKASNVYLSSNQLPPEVQGFLTNSSNVVSKNSKQYLAGYQPLDTGLDEFSAQAVPMRPGEQPHLVGINDFQAATQSPLGSGSSSLIPPNAFRSGGSGIELNATNANLTMHSTAIIGTLNKDFAVSIPRGYMIIDNTGTLGFTGNTGGGQTALSQVLMQPSYIGLAKAPFGTVFGKPGKVEAVVNYVNQHANDNPRPNVPADILAGVDSPSNLNNSQAYQMKNLSIHQCDNVSSITGGPGPHDQDCIDNYNNFLAFYGSQVPPTTTSATDLMAVEAFKCYVLKVRSAVGSSGCGSAVAPAECTGLKKYDINGSYCLPCNFASAGTLTELLSEVTGASSLANDLKVRMRQIKPSATDSELDSVLASTVAFGQTSYIYMNGGANGTLVLSTTPPSFPINSSAAPDGKLVTYQTPNVNLNGTIINVPSCEGYPNPWDCPAVPASAQNKALWTPSSGFNNLLGVLRFMNCAGGGGEWCCPC